MATRTAEVRVLRINTYKLSAVLAQLLSYMTTYWAVEWIAEPKTDQQYAIAMAVALAFEFLLVKMKSLLFDEAAENDGIGWLGFVIDAVINAGGIVTKSGRLLTWPPIAAILAAFGLNAADPRTNAIGGFVVALALGAMLSFLPHRLWRAGSPRK